MEVDFFLKRDLFDTIDGERQKVDVIFQEVDESFFTYFIERLDEGFYHKCVSVDYLYDTVSVVLDMSKYFSLLGTTFVRDHIDPNYQSNI